MPAAARLGDPHKCPLTETVTRSCCDSHPPHEGGPVIEATSPDVKHDGIPAARVFDKASCKSTPRPVDMITTGSGTVKYNNRPAAVVGSRTMHTGEVIKGSPTVFIGGPIVAASAGDAQAGKNACLDAAKNRKDGQKQGLPMNCGYEAVRTACIQRCGGCSPKGSGPPDACKACDVKETDWYDSFWDDPEIVKAQDDSAERANENIRKANDAKWPQVRTAGAVTAFGGKYDPPATWPSGGGTFYLFKDEHARVYNDGPVAVVITPLYPIPSKPEEIKKARGTGSNDDGRKKMLEKKCGLPSDTPNNDMSNIAGGLADGKVVIVPVDLGPWKDNKKDYGGQLHVVTVTQITFNDDGSIKEVSYTDTSRPDGCNPPPLTGPNAQRLENSLVPNSQLNVVG